VRPKPPTLPSISVSDKMTHDTGISIVVSNVAGSFPPAPDSVTPSNTLLQYRFDGASAWTTAEGNFETLGSVTVSKALVHSQRETTHLKHAPYGVMEPGSV